MYIMSTTIPRKSHNNKDLQKRDIYKGTMAPLSQKDKILSHYGPKNGGYFPFERYFGFNSAYKIPQKPGI